MRRSRGPVPAGGLADVRDGGQGNVSRLASVKPPMDSPPGTSCRDSPGLRQLGGGGNPLKRA